MFPLNEHQLGSPEAYVNSRSVNSNLLRKNRCFSILLTKYIGGSIGVSVRATRNAFRNKPMPSLINQSINLLFTAVDVQQAVDEAIASAVVFSNVFVIVKMSRDSACYIEFP